MTPPISLDEARQILLHGFDPLGTEWVALSAAVGRTLAASILANDDQPQSAQSAMDGYAVRSANIALGVRLKLIGEALAGAPYSGDIGAGECVRIATGGVVPGGSDRIVIQEHVERDGDFIVISDTSGPAFIRPAAMDFAAGDTLVAAGSPLSPAAIGLAAAAGLAELGVARMPRVAILTGGDELREPGEALVPGAVYNSAAFALAALVKNWSAIAVAAPIEQDNEAAIAAAIRTTDNGADLFVAVGGASVGKRDLVRAAFAMAGAKEKFWRINLVPGKPCWHARMADGRAVLGLPGNPTSAFVCAHLLLRPLIDVLSGRDPAMQLMAARLAEPIGANGKREAWLRASVSSNSEGTMNATIDRRQDSGLQTPLLAANALVRRLPDATALEAGSLVEYLPLQAA